MPAPATIEILAEASRRQILDALRDGEQPVQLLVNRLQLTQPAVSKQLRVLREAGLVQVRPDGQRRLYRLRLEPFIELDEWLEPYRQMWRHSLDRLERRLAEPPEPADPAEPTGSRGPTNFGPDWRTKVTNRSKVEEPGEPRSSTHRGKP
ncbi:MAG: winged helix-turn-helix transcriptional regulator [Solirubrobacterales bacterium]|nr:winged helix-turn-helix transcriptional regulator [Solirubrobacterales bacterium]